VFVSHDPVSYFTHHAENILNSGFLRFLSLSAVELRRQHVQSSLAPAPASDPKTWANV